MSRAFLVPALLSLSLFACSGSGSGDDTPLGPDGGGGGGGDAGSGATECVDGITRMTAGTTVTVNSTTSGANPPREYCLVVPSGSSEIRLHLEGGTCDSNDCTDDVEMYLKRGDLPDPFDPDGATTQWTYTPDPGGYGDYVKSAQAGIWYLSLIDGQYTLGYSGVEMSVMYP